MTDSQEVSALPPRAALPSSSSSAGRAADQLGHPPGRSPFAEQRVRGGAQVRPQHLRPVVLEACDQRSVVGGQLRRPAGTAGAASRNSRISPLSAACAASIRGLCAAWTIAACRPAWASLISLHFVARSQAASSSARAAVHRVGQPAAVALEREVRGLELERGAQLVQPADVLARSAGRRARRDAARSPPAPRRRARAARRAASGARRRSASTSSRSRSQAPAGSAPSRISRRSASARASTVDMRCSGRGAAITRAPVRARRHRGRRPDRQRDQPAEHEPGAGDRRPAQRLGEHDRAEHRGRERLGQRERRGVGGAQATRARWRTAGTRARSARSRGTARARSRRRAAARSVGWRAARGAARARRSRTPPP